MRRPAAASGKRTARSMTFYAPVAGWVRNQNMGRPDPTSPQGAYILKNIFPTAIGAELRGGSAIYALLGDGTKRVTSFLRYKNGNNEKLFAADEGAIYEISNVTAPEVRFQPVISGLKGGNWSSAQFETTGGIFIIAVNGADEMRLFDGESWYALGASDMHEINYAEMTKGFSVGATLTGPNNATAVIVAVQPRTASTGRLVVRDLSGTFRDGVAITDSTGGAAVQAGDSIKIFNGITGIDTRKLSYVWAFKNRLFAVEKDTMNFWYAEIDQIGGALTPFPNAGNFPLGGSILFGASWSLDRGASGGLSNQCILVSTEGEVAVFQGTDPKSASDWGLVGVYSIGTPLGPNAWFRSGADVVILTTVGAIPLSQALTRDLASLSPAAVSYPIETEWNEAVLARMGLNWNVVVWPERQMVLTALPTPSGSVPKMYAANARTGRWGEFTNWNGHCLVVYQGRVFWGGDNGKVIEGYVGGLDEGSTYTGVYVPLFEDSRTPASRKIANLARSVVKSNAKVAVGVSMQYDFELRLPSAPDAAPIATANVWGKAIWGQAKWGGTGEKTVQQDWQSVSGSGYALAPALQITSGSVVPLETEIIRIDVTYTIGDVLS